MFVYYTSAEVAWSSRFLAMMIRIELSTERARNHLNTSEHKQYGLKSG